MHLTLALIVLVGLAVFIVWIADWTTLGDRTATAGDILKRAKRRTGITYSREREGELSIVPDFLSTRQNPIPEVPVDDSKRMLEAVANEFGIRWLEAGEDNPVQQLWRRRDWLATYELLTLGDAVEHLRAIDPAWTKRQIAEMKSDNSGTRSGATFEILGLNLFRGAHAVEPASVNNPGYDGRVRFRDGSSLILSIKNHGISSGELYFRSRAASVKDAFVNALRRRRVNGAQQRIIATAHPSPADWKTLKDRMDDNGGTIGPNETAPWSGLILPIDERFHPLSADHISYAIVLAAPYHPNEQKNFYSNIEKGIANLVKHHGQVGADVCRGLLLRISETAQPLDCAAWARQFFDDYPDTPLELILLYQVAVATDVANNESFIAHYFCPVFGPNFAAWHAGNVERRFAIRVLIGKMIDNPSRLVLTQGTNGPQIALNGHYVFQNGKIFPHHRLGNTPLSISLSVPAPGVSVIPIIDRMGGIGAILPPEMRLTLLP